MLQEGLNSIPMRVVQTLEGNPIKRSSTQIVAEDVGVSLKYAQVGGLSQGYSTDSTGSSPVASQTATSNIEEPVARPMEEID